MELISSERDVMDFFAIPPSMTCSINVAKTVSNGFVDILYKLLLSKYNKNIGIYTNFWLLL